MDQNFWIPNVRDPWHGCLSSILWWSQICLGYFHGSSDERWMEWRNFSEQHGMVAGLTSLALKFVDFSKTSALGRPSSLRCPRQVRCSARSVVRRRCGSLSATHWADPPGQVNPRSRSRPREECDFPMHCWRRRVSSPRTSRCDCSFFSGHPSSRSRPREAWCSQPKGLWNSNDRCMSCNFLSNFLDVLESHSDHRDNRLDLLESHLDLHDNRPDRLGNFLGLSSHPGRGNLHDHGSFRDLEIHHVLLRSCCWKVRRSLTRVWNKNENVENKVRIWPWLLNLMSFLYDYFLYIFKNKLYSYAIIRLIFQIMSKDSRWIAIDLHIKFECKKYFFYQYNVK